MQIEIHLPSGRLFAIVGQSTFYDIQFTVNGQGDAGARLRSECIPHDTMCGPFSRDPAIKAQSQILGRAGKLKGDPTYWAAQYIKQFGIIP